MLDSLNFIKTKNNKNSFNLIENIYKITSIGKIIITQKKNNFIVSVTDINGNVLYTESPGTIGYRKSKRKSFYAYSEVIKIIIYKIKKNSNLKNFQIIFRGICKGKKQIIGTISKLDINIYSIVSEVLFPKNGCRPKKQRRL